MFDGLNGKLSQVFDGLKRRGSLRAEDVDLALRDIRLALLEADVALGAVKSFIDEIREQATGQAVIKSVAPGQQVVKIVHDAMIRMLASKLDEEGKPVPVGLNFMAAKPVIMLMVGLQGSGKTTSTAKLAHHITHKENKRVLMASLDVQRPAAQEQLRQLAEANGLNVLPIVANQTPSQITERALSAANLGAYDILLLDSAGRTTLDQPLMDELVEVKRIAPPTETLLVADAMTGQDAARTGKAFHDQLGLSGIILTRVDGDARGGAALSMRHVTNCPIKFIGVGEKIDALDRFDAERIAGRILDMGDIVSLVEKASETIEQEEAEKLAKKMQKGRFDLNDMALQLKQMKKMGGVGNVLGLIPGMGQMMKQMDSNKLDKDVFTKQEAIINSMTKGERRNPTILHASRKQRIAKGSGTTPNDVNKLLKQHAMMAKAMKQMSQGGGGMMGALTQMMGGGGMPSPTGGGLGLPSAGLGMGGLGGGLGMPAMGMPAMGAGRKTNNRKKKKRRK